MNVWIDLANAPHVLFFLPILGELRRQECNIFFTLRDFNKTVELAKKYGIEGTVIGHHGGKNNLTKILNLVGRSRSLVSYGKNLSIDISVSHNSYTHTIAGRLIRSKVVTLMDYEGQPANHIAFRTAHKVIVPTCFPEEALRKFGANEKTVYKYDGFKEQVYLSKFSVDKDFPEQLKKTCSLPHSWNLQETVLVTLRAPATMAAYHKFHNKLFDILLDRINGNSNLTPIVLARNDSQRKYYSQKFPNLIFPEAPLSGEQLIYHSDVVISAGGTMNREAAILGVPVYTIFGGELPAVDRQLIELGRMTPILTLDDISRIRFRKNHKQKILKNPSLCSEIVTQITS